MRWPIAGRQFWLWRAVDDEGEVLDLLVQRRRDKPAAVPEGANAVTQAIAMIETRAALDALDDILSVDGLDGVYVGPSDLSIALANGTSRAAWRGGHERGAAGRRARQGAREIRQCSVSTAPTHGRRRRSDFSYAPFRATRRCCASWPGANSPLRGPGELKDGGRHWKNRFEHQYIVNVGVAARERCGSCRIDSRRARQNVHLQV
jgi:hypothetical protein